MSETQNLTFGPFEMNLETEELWQDGELVKLQPQPAKILARLLEQAGQLVTRDELQQHVWGDTVVDFDQGLNSAVRQIRGVLGDRAEAPDYVETVPRRGYRFIAPVFAVESEAARRAPLVLESRVRNPTMVATFLITLLLGTGFFLVFTSETPVNSTEQERLLLAVLPFKSLGADHEAGYFGDGMTEELIAEIGSLNPQRLGVIARTSAMRYRDTDKSAQQIGEELGVRYLLEGSVRLDDEALRITARLVQVGDQSNLWTRRYDRPAGDALRVQRDVAEQVARSLALELLPQETDRRAEPPEPAPEARAAYLEGRYHLAKRTPEGLEKSFELFQRAVETDPSYAPAHAALAEAALKLAWNKRHFVQTARQALKTALKLNEHLPEAHLQQASLALYYDWDLEMAERSYLRALELAPGMSQARHAYAGFLSALGRHDESLAEVERALELDPVSPLLNGDFGWNYFLARRYDEAIRQASRTLELEPGDGWARACLLHSSVLLGRFDDAVRHAQEMLRMKGASDEEIQALAQGDPFEGLKIYLQWNLAYARQHDFRPSAATFAFIHAELGLTEAALEWLERAYDERDSGLIFAAVEPRLDGLRDRPQFQRLLERIGLPST